jgi:hypothetical protein
MAAKEQMMEIFRIFQVYLLSLSIFTFDLSLLLALR